jgi:hypothetical protein
MYSYMRRRGFSSLVTFGARRYGNYNTNASPSEATFAIRQFHSIAQLQGQALAEFPRHDQARQYESTGEFTSFQSAAHQAPGVSSSRPSALDYMHDANSMPLRSISRETVEQGKAVPLYFRGSLFDKEPYWQKIGRWKDVPEEQFLSHRWNVSPTFFPYQFASPIVSIDRQEHPRLRWSLQIP